MSTETMTAPRIRWAAIIWGALFALVAGAALWLLSDGDRRAAAGETILGLTPVTITTAVILTVGVLLLATGAAGLMRRVQIRSADDPETAPRPSVVGIPARSTPE